MFPVLGEETVGDSTGHAAINLSRLVAESERVIKGWLTKSTGLIVSAETTAKNNLLLSLVSNEEESPSLSEHQWLKIHAIIPMSLN